MKKRRKQNPAYLDPGRAAQKAAVKKQVLREYKNLKQGTPELPLGALSRGGQNGM